MQSVFLKDPKAIPLKYNQKDTTCLPVSVEGENPNLPASRHSWPSNMYTEQPLV